MANFLSKTLILAASCVWTALFPTCPSRPTTYNTLFKALINKSMPLIALMPHNEAVQVKERRQHAAAPQGVWLIKWGAPFSILHRYPTVALSAPFMINPKWVRLASPRHLSCDDKCDRLALVSRLHSQVSSLLYSNRWRIIADTGVWRRGQGGRAKQIKWNAILILI